MPWWRVVCALSAYGFLKEFRPSEPFISPYLNGPWKNITETEINQDIFPIGTYSNMVLLIGVFLLTDWLRYKPVLILQGISGVITWSLLSWAQGIPLMQVVQFFYGLFCAADVAYFSYLYAKIDKKYYQKATAQVKTALLIGKAGSGLISQFLVIYNCMDYQQLNYLTLGAMSIATLWAMFLPPAPQSTYFHRRRESENSKMPSEHEESPQTEQMKLNSEAVLSEQLREEPDSAMLQKIPNSKIEEKKMNKCLPANTSCMIVFHDFTNVLKDEYVIKWSIWWALSMCGFLQVTYYMQLLWQDVINQKENPIQIYHGFSNCAHSLIGAICTYFVGYVKLKWDLYGEVALAICSLLQGCLLIYSSQISSLMTGYSLYIVYRVLYQTSNTIATSELAKHLKADSYALIFGVNTFAALLAQSVLTFVVIDCLEANIRTQFIIYGGYYVVIGIGFTFASLATVYHFITSRKSTHS